MPLGPLGGNISFDFTYFGMLRPWVCLVLDGCSSDRFFCASAAEPSRFSTGDNCGDAWESTAMTGRKADPMLEIHSFSMEI